MVGASVSKITLLEQEIMGGKYRETILQEIDVRLEALIESKLDVPVESLEAKKVLTEVDKLRADVNDVKGMTEGLRQAINPSKPEEVLTIARLSDQVRATKQNVERLETDLKEKHIALRGSVARELDATSNATNLIIVALIPLILNLGYSIWKDRKSFLKEKTPKVE